LKRLTGRRDVKDALLQLDLLMKEESLMVVVKNLEVAHHIDGNVNEIKVLAGDIDGSINEIKALAGDIDDKVQRVDENVKTANERM
jgi:hypothetical protein